MTTKNQENWFANYEALKAHVLETGHFPNKHDKRLNWYKYNAKLIKQGRQYPSTESILEDMRTIRCVEHDNRRKFITPFVGGQVTICNAFGFKIPEGCCPTYVSKKSTKGKRSRPSKPKVETTN